MHRYPRGVNLAAVNGRRERGGTSSVLVRGLLVVAVILGLCAMHVLAAGVDQQHRAVHDATATAVQHPRSAPAQAGGRDFVSVTATAQVMAHATEHDHHHAMGDCVLFLAAGIAVLVTLLAWATVRALRPGYWLLPAWWTQIATSTPWRGPPPWHWPRIHLCVIRV